MTHGREIPSSAQTWSFRGTVSCSEVAAAWPLSWAVCLFQKYSLGQLSPEGREGLLGGWHWRPLSSPPVSPPLMLKLKLHYFGHLMQRANSLEKTLMLGRVEGRRKRGNRGHHRLSVHEFEHALGVGDGQGSLAYCNPCSCKGLDMTE